MMNLQKHLLRHVFNVLGPPDQAGDGTHDPLAIGQYNLIEGSIVARPRLLYLVKLDEH